MEELINDIENISINSNNADDSNNRDFEKSDNICDNEILPKVNLEDYSILSLTPIKDSPKDRFRNCILCRDYSSPICKECSNNGSEASRKSKQNKIIPDGKVKALAKQFEDILPDGMNNQNFSVINDCMLCKEESINEQMYISSNPISEYDTDANIKDFTDEGCEDFDIRSKTMKNQLTPIIDPNLCEQIDPIKAIITSSYNHSKCSIVETLNIESCKSIDLQLISTERKAKNMFEYSIKESDAIFGAFESLNPLEQRTLLLKWITDTLNRSETSSELSEDEVQEVIQILKGIVSELECSELCNRVSTLANENALASHSTQNIPSFNDRVESRNMSIPSDRSQVHKQSKVNLVNSKLQINIGIPEDEEIEEERINELIFNKSNNFSCNIESNSLIIDENSLSPKSDIGLDDDELVKSSIKEIGNNFFGFFE